MQTKTIVIPSESFYAIPKLEILLKNKSQRPRVLSGFYLAQIVLLLAFFSKLSLTDAQNTNRFPPLFQEPSNNIQSGGCFLKDGSYVSIGTGWGTNKPVMIKYSPTGKVIRRKNWTGPFSHMEYDSDFNRIYLVTLSNPYHCAVRLNYYGYYLNPQVRRLQILCMDTSLTPIWSKSFQASEDSITTFNAIAPDGLGGIYLSGRVSGKVSAAIASIGGNLNLSTRLKGGYNFILRLGNGGETKWTRIQNDYPSQSSPFRATGHSFIVPRKGKILDILTCYADTIGSRYTPGEVQNIFTIQRVRMDSAGTVLFRKKGISYPSYFPTEQGTVYKFLPITVDGKERYALLAERLYPVYYTNASVLLFDTNFNFMGSKEILFNKGIDAGATDMVVLGKDRIGVFGRQHYPAAGNYIYSGFLILNLKSRVIEQRHTTRANYCYNYPGFFSPVISAYPRQGEGDSTSVLIHYSNGPFEFYGRGMNVAMVTIEKGTNYPCEPFHEPAFPENYNPAGGFNLTWGNGDLLWRPVPGWQLYDTLLVFTPIPEPVTLVNLCLPLHQNILPNDTVLCGDSLLLKNLASSYRQKLTINGIAATDSQFTVKQSGLYILQLSDTCRVSQTIIDSIRVTLEKAEKPVIQPDTLLLCPDQSTKITLQEEKPQISYQWKPETGLSNSVVGQPVVSSNSLPDGYFQFELMAKTPVGCLGKDTLVVYNSPGPNAKVKTTQPDTLLYLADAQWRNPFWTINGGFSQSPPNLGQIKVFWGPWFEGQNASVTIADSLGCPKTLVYQRQREIAPSIQIPNLVTLNQDGKNEKFEVLGLSPQDKFEISIYNRWGKLVFSSSHYDGSFPSFDIEPGVYFAWIKASYVRNGAIGEQQFSSWITVLK